MTVPILNSHQPNGNYQNNIFRKKKIDENQNIRFGDIKVQSNDI